LSKFDKSEDRRYSRVTERLNTDSGEAWQVHEEAMLMQKNGEDVVVLSIGDPDFRTPEPIIDNAISHMRVGRTHYSPALGELNLRRAVADYETKTSTHPCLASEVSIYPGVTSAIFAVMSCLLNAGEEIVVADPTYVGYIPVLQALNVKVKTVMCLSENNFEPQLKDLVAAITSETRVVFLNTPGNPTGAIISRDTLKKLASYCRERNIWLVCDEVYSMFTYESPHVSLRTAADRLDNIVVIDGLSKSHAMSGWRVGWAVAPEELTEHLGRFSVMSTFGSPQFIQDAAAFALNNDEYYVREMRNKYQARRDLVCSRLEQIPTLKFLRPESGMFIMVDVTELFADDKEFAKKLLDAEKVSVLPGSAFGVSTSGHIRLSLVQPEEILIEGCNRLQRFIHSLS